MIRARGRPWPLVAGAGVGLQALVEELTGDINEGSILKHKRKEKGVVATRCATTCLCLTAIYCSPISIDGSNNLNL